MSIRVTEWVLDVLVITLISALCILCTGTCFYWRRVFKWLLQNS